LIDQNTCNKIEEDIFGRVTNTLLCTDPMDGNFTICGGDSGGPLVQNIDGEVQLIGVVTFASINCGPEHTIPSFYTRVMAFEDWILEIIGGNEGGYDAGK
jgi:secreted trypsin-like serine protease